MSSTLTPLISSSKLAKTPTQKLRYEQTVKDKNSNDVKVACPKATRALVALMNQHAVIGGAACHWGGPAAFAEIMSALHAIMFSDKTIDWSEKYNFVNDAGHTENGLYALRANYSFDNLTFEDLKKFRSIESKLTGHGESHLNPESVLLSNGPLGSGVAAAEGLAIADNLIGNNRNTVLAISDGACMEGEAKEAFASIPGLAKKGKLNPFLMLVSDNNTKLSGRIDEDSFSLTPCFESFNTLGFDTRVVENGHDLQDVYKAIETAFFDINSVKTKPICLIFKTIKGYGNKATQESASGGHGYPLKAYDPRLESFIQEIYGQNAPEEFISWAREIISSKPESNTNNNTGFSDGPVMEKVQPGFARATIKAAEAGLPVFSLTSDLPGSTGIAAFHKAFPNHYIDMGIAESNMVGTAVGLSKQGLIPIVDTFAQFGVTKGNLPLIMASLSQSPVIALFSHTGYQDAADGASHQATTYMAAVSSIPHTTVINCTCSSEAESLMTQAISSFKEKREKGENPDSVIFFFGRENHPSYFVKEAKYEWEKAQVVTEGKHITIVATGPLLQKAIKAADILKSKNISATVINNSFVNKPDTKTIGESVAKTGGLLVTLEDHQLIGGMGSMLSHALLQDGYQFKLKSLGGKGQFGQSAYKANELYKLHGMDCDNVVEACQELLSL